MNNAVKLMAPEDNLDQLGSVLPRIIATMAEAPVKDSPIRMNKADLKDGFWRMVCEAGQERNFAYILLNHACKPVDIIGLLALQTSWAKLPPFFCATSEMARGIAALYAAKPAGSLPPDPLQYHTMPIEEELPFCLPNVASMSGKAEASFLQLLECFVDNFIQLVQLPGPEVLRHCSCALMRGIHSVSSCRRPHWGTVARTLSH